MQYTLDEILHPPKIDTRTGEEITAEVCARTGIVILED